MFPSIFTNPDFRYHDDGTVVLKAIADGLAGFRLSHKHGKPLYWHRGLTKIGSILNCLPSLETLKNLAVEHIEEYVASPSMYEDIHGVDGILMNHINDTCMEPLNNILSYGDDMVTLAEVATDMFSTLNLTEFDPDNYHVHIPAKDIKNGNSPGIQST